MARERPAKLLWKDLPHRARVMPIIPMWQGALIDFTEEELMELHKLAMAELPQTRYPETTAIVAICKSVAADLDRRGKANYWVKQNRWAKRERKGR